MVSHWCHWCCFNTTTGHGRAACSCVSQGQQDGEVFSKHVLENEAPMGLENKMLNIWNAMMLVVRGRHVQLLHVLLTYHEPNWVAVWPDSWRTHDSSSLALSGKSYIPGIVVRQFKLDLDASCSWFDHVQTHSNRDKSDLPSVQFYGVKRG